MPEADKVSRVTMEWPADLKEKVRDKVGPRGLTPFTLEAVNRLFDHRYGTAKVEEPAPVEPVPVAVAPEEPVLESVVSPPPAPEPVEDDFDEHAPMFTQGRKPEPQPEAVVPTMEDIRKEHEQMDAEEAAGPPDLPHDVQAPKSPEEKKNLFAKLQQEGKELGIDLKPASEVLKPHAKEEEVPTSPPARAPEGMETCPFHPEMVVKPGGECYKCTLENNGTDTRPNPAPAAAPPVAAPAPAVAASDVCPDCGSVLIDGLCYECF